jgi:hypothetical protein
VPTTKEFKRTLDQLCEKIYLLNDMAKPIPAKKRPQFIRRESIIQKLDVANMQKNKAYLNYKSTPVI